MASANGSAVRLAFARLCAHEQPRSLAGGDAIGEPLAAGEDYILRVRVEETAAGATRVTDGLGSDRTVWGQIVN